MRHVKVDLFAAGAAVLTAVMFVVYLVLLDQQSSSPPPWYVALLLFGGIAASYGAVIGLPQRTAALGAAAAVLGVCGLLGLLTIGLPLVLAAVLCLASAVRSSSTSPI